mgnify:CR=1 FL=1
MKDEDAITGVFSASTHTPVLFFATNGKAGSTSQARPDRRISASAVPSAMPPTMATSVSWIEKNRPLST